MSSAEVAVFVVDDDPRVRRSLKWLIESVGLAVVEYASGDHFLQTYSAGQRGCLVLDMRMQGLSGLQVLEELVTAQALPPTIVLTGHGDVRMAVRAMKLGAFDFIEKPYADQEFLDTVQRACQEEKQRHEQREARSAVARRFATLTARELEVLERLLGGEANKSVAGNLGISEKTVEVHRKSIMRKTGARSLAELITIALQHRDHTGNP